MIIEFNIDNDELINLSLIKKEDTNDCYQLIDKDRNVCAELKLEDNKLSILECTDSRILQDKDLYYKLDNLFYKILEVEKSGTDVFSENIEQLSHPYDPDKIKVRSDKLALLILSKMIDNGSVDLFPEFQRNLVWDSFQKSRLIESILLRIPLPMFYFAEDMDGNLTVIDGLQRITSIKEFMDNKFPLRGLQYLQDTCEGKYYESKGNKKGIDIKYQRWFDLTSISANIIDPSSPSKVKYDIFRRINTGGKTLNNQEIRNCLTGKGMRAALKKMTLMSEFVSATDKSAKSVRMEDRELALRFLNFTEMYENAGNFEAYSGNMDESLDAYTENKIRNSVGYFENHIQKFSNAMQNAEYLIGGRYAFRKIRIKDIQPNSYKQLLNKAIFVCCSVLLSSLKPEIVKQFNAEGSLRHPIAELIENDDTLFAYLSYGTNGKANLIYTLKEFKNLFNTSIKMS